jgi:hypothetical protein
MTHIIDIQWLNEYSLPPSTPVVVSEGVKRGITTHFREGYPALYRDGRIIIRFDRIYQDRKLFYLIMSFITATNETIDYIFKFTLYE